MNSNKDFLIYGKRAVYEALENNVEIDKVFVEKNNSFVENIKSRVHKKGINISFVPIMLFISFEQYFNALCCKALP